ncbi:MAG: hypothetical protein JWO58_3080 [Chitinophagaceae bacterium]|nr:hypothetical protein [Chitinophagaceae bacterium]
MEHENRDLYSRVPYSRCKCCRKGIRTTYGAVSYRAKENFVVNPIRYVYSELSTPETGGHVCQFHHPTV